MKGDAGAHPCVADTVRGRRQELVGPPLEQMVGAKRRLEGVLPVVAAEPLVVGTDERFAPTDAATQPRIGRDDARVAARVRTLARRLAGIERLPVAPQRHRAVEPHADDLVRVVGEAGVLAGVGLVLEIGERDRLVARHEGPRRAQQIDVGLPLLREHGPDAVEVTVIEFDAGQALVLEVDAIEDLHHLAKFDIADEAGVVEFERLTTEADHGLRQSGEIEIKLIEVGDFRIGDARKAR